MAPKAPSRKRKARGEPSTLPEPRRSRRLAEKALAVDSISAEQRTEPLKATRARTQRQRTKPRDVTRSVPVDAQNQTILKASMTWEGTQETLAGSEMLPEQIATLIKTKRRQSFKNRRQQAARLEIILESIQLHLAPVNDNEPENDPPRTPKRQVRQLSISPSLGLTPGPSLVRKYRIGAQVGDDASGATAVVKLGRLRNAQTSNSPEKPRVIALKSTKDTDVNLTRLMRADLERLHRKAERGLIREIKFLIYLEHPRIIKYLGHDFEKGQLVIALPLKNGDVYDLFEASSGELYVAMSDQDERDTVTPEQWRNRSKVLWRLWTQMLEALEFVHSKNIVHLDVKPNNILYDYHEEEGGRVFNFYLTDFGLSEKRGAFIWTTDNKFVGTHGYCALEMEIAPFGVDSSAHPSADSWSIYRTLWPFFADRTLYGPGYDYLNHWRDMYALDSALKPWIDMVNIDPMMRMTCSRALELIEENRALVDFSSWEPRWLDRESSHSGSKLFGSRSGAEGSGNGDMSSE